MRLGLVRRGGSASRQRTFTASRLSVEQQQAVQARMARAGLKDVTVTLTDYRDVTGTI